jgi:hypothetical protein
MDESRRVQMRRVIGKMNDMQLQLQQEKKRIIDEIEETAAYLNELKSAEVFECEECGLNINGYAYEEYEGRCKRCYGE